MPENNTKTFYHDCGKGDRPRGMGWKNYYDNFDSIFGKKEDAVVEENLVAGTTVEVTKADEG